MSGSKRKQDEAEELLAADRLQLVAALDQIIKRRVGTRAMTVADLPGIMAEYDELRRQRYGARLGQERGTLYNLVARMSREAWLESVDTQARRARKALGL